MKNLTVNDILRMKPCAGYEEDRLVELGGGKDALTPLEILDLDIPIEDRFWVVLRYDVIGQKLCDTIACDIAEHVLPIFEREYPEDKRPREAIEITRRHIAGEVNDAAWAAAWAAARDAAWDAAWAAAWAAARAAAWDAARAAAWDAAWDAAWAAARAAARAAAGAAAGAAEREWQLEQVKKILQGAS